jgi:hypothetical protein
VSVKEITLTTNTDTMSPREFARAAMNEALDRIDAYYRKYAANVFGPASAPAIVPPVATTPATPAPKSRAAKKPGGRDGLAKPAAKAEAKPKASTRKKGEKRDPAVLKAIEDKLLAYIASNPGQRAEQINKALGFSIKDANLPMKHLLGEKKIRAEGQKRATQYFAV